MAGPINPNRIDLASLRLLVQVVSAGSLTAGAQRFGISLAAASKRIAELELHVGSPLLARSKKGVVPTAAGQTLLRHAIEVVAGVEQLALAMHDLRTGVAGHLRLWANTSAFVGFLPDLLAAYVAAHPLVRLDLEDAFSDDAVRAVLAGPAELAIIGEGTAAPGLETVLCDCDELVLLLPLGHRLASLGPVAFEDALAEDFVALVRAASLTRQIANAASAIGTPLKVRIQVRSFDAMCRMVASGLGVAVLPRTCAPPHVAAQGLQLCSLRGLPVERRLLLAMRTRGSLSPAAAALVDLAARRMEHRRPDLARTG